MDTTPEQVRELHRIHRQLRDLKRRAARGPKQIQFGEQAVARGEAELAAAKEAKTRARMDYDEKQTLLQQRETKIEGLEKKLNECKTNTEFKMLKDQIAAERQANSVLEDEILEKLEKIDELTAQIEKCEAALAKTREELAKTRNRVEGEQQMLESELARVRQELVVAENALPADIRPDYERVVRARGEDALAEVDGECCGHCYTRLTPQTINELFQGKTLFCKSCGTLLYLKEGLTPG